MFDHIKRFLADREAGPVYDAPGDALQAAAAALLIEAARMDDAVDAAERERIVELLRWRFGLSEVEAHLLVNEAERAAERSVENYGFTATIRRSFTDAERIQLMEMLWDVAYADGTLHDLEASLMRRIAGLLYVSDRDSGAARQRVLARHGLSDENAAS
jgi:uncharacterized tellurite resistance protein B-like protein